MTSMERRIQAKLEAKLVGKFQVSIQGNRVTLSASNLSADSLWDEIHAASIFGEEASGWMSSHPEDNNVTLPLNKMVI